MISFFVVAEDWLSIYVIRSILNTFPNKFTIHREDCKNGFGAIKRDIKKYNEAAKYMPIFALTDLDNDFCPSRKITDWLDNTTPSEKMFFRIAVKEIESWLLADREGFAGFLNISQSNIGNTPDQLADPKNELFRLVKKSRQRRIREAILPANGSDMGPAYNSTLQSFVETKWDLTRAQINSPSLQRTIHALHSFHERNNS